MLTSCEAACRTEGRIPGSGELLSYDRMESDVQAAPEKIDLLLKATGDAPIMIRKKWSVNPDQTVGWVITFIRQYLNLPAEDSLVSAVSVSAFPHSVPVLVREPGFCSRTRSGDPQPAPVLWLRRQTGPALRQVAGLGLIVMSARILVSEKPAVKLQLLPFSLDHSGKAHVSQFFESTVQTNSPSDLRASFRGRPLRGREVAVPSGCIGIVVRADGKQGQQTLVPAASFSHITSWKWDQDPASDSLSAAFDWPEVAAAIHSSPPTPNPLK